MLQHLKREQEMGSPPSTERATPKPKLNRYDHEVIPAIPLSRAFLQHCYV